MTKATCLPPNGPKPVVMDDPPSDVANLIPLQRAAWAAARVVERLMREDPLGIGRFQGHLEHIGHWNTGEGGMHLALLLVGQDRKGIAAVVSPRTWDRMHLGLIRWEHFPRPMGAAERGIVAHAANPLVVRGGIDLGSAHARLHWRTWCADLARQGQAL